MSTSKFKIDNKELLRALGIAQTTRGRQHSRYPSQYSQYSAFQESDSAFEMTRKFDQSTITLNNVEENEDPEDPEDRGQFLFSLDIDITEEYKDFLDVYTNDKPYELARSFCDKHNIETEIADVIAARIVENAKATLMNRGNMMSSQLTEEQESEEDEEDHVMYKHYQIMPKGGDDSVDEISSPSITKSRVRVMEEKDMNIGSETKVMFTDAKEVKPYEVLTSGVDEMMSRYNASTKDTKSGSFTKVFTEETISPMRSHSKRTTTDRFYEKTLRDIENRVRKDAIITDIHNQEKYKECTFHPTINPVSLKLATNRKSDVSTEDMLLLKGKITEERRMIIKQNARAKENRNNTFRPEINNKSKCLDEKNRPNYEQRERFEDLYQEYRVLHEKRNQLRARMSTEYSFNPNCNTSKKLDKDGPKFLDRLAEDIEKRKTKKENEDIPQESVPTFCPKILKTASDGSRNAEKLPVGEYLYKMSHQLENKKADLREASDKELRAKAPKCTGKSAMIIQANMKKNLESLFENLDNDKDGLISSSQINMEAVPKELSQVLAPLFTELKESNSEQNLNQFMEACYKLLKTADPTVKTFLALDLTKRQVKDREELLQKREQEIGMVFHPKIDQKSKKMAGEGEQRQGRVVYQRLYAEKAKSEIRMKELRDKAASEEIKECSFHPVINKYPGGTEAFYERTFARLDVSF